MCVLCLVFIKYSNIIRNACYSKDARLPIQLQRAMAAEAEAAREARAKVQPYTESCLDLPI